jgi:hypothetical protein
MRPASPGCASGSKSSRPLAAGEAHTPTPTSCVLGGVAGHRDEGSALTGHWASMRLVIQTRAVFVVALLLGTAGGRRDEAAYARTTLYDRKMGPAL